MKGFLKSKAFFILFLAFTAAIGFFSELFIFKGNPPVNIQAATQELGGFAWSSNIGWISFNCSDGKKFPAPQTQDICPTSNYKVLIDSSGFLSGYAWSSSIGWINFAPAGPYPGTPQNSAKLDPATGNASGWARACAVFQSGCSGALRLNLQTGGWDGWIKMAKSAGDSGGDYGLRFASSTGAFMKGTISAGNPSDRYFAWGSDVIGWLNFCVAPDTSECVGRISGTTFIEPPPSSTSTTSTPPGWHEVPPQ